MAVSGGGGPSDEMISGLSGAVERMNHLLFLLTLWDEGFRQVKAGGDRGDALMRLGTTIDERLGQLDTDVRVFQRICGDYPEWVNDGVQRSLAAQADPPAHEEARRLLLAGADSFATSGEARARALVGRAGSQRAELRDATDGFKAANRSIDWHGLSCDLGAVVAMGGGAICAISEGTAGGACIAGAAGFLYVVVAC